MSDICVAYWSGTGNTEAMAQAIGAGITAAGKSADVVPMETISPADLKDQTVWVLGCPAMGAEEPCILNLSTTLSESSSTM